MEYLLNAKHEYKKLIEAMGKNCSKYDLSRIEEAYYLAVESHRGQKRESGEEYYTHPLSVALILIDLGMDSDSIIAALLHDVVEDTDISILFIKSKFGDEIAGLVDGVTKIKKLKVNSKDEQQAENIRKLLLAMSKDIRVIIIKLADRLHNMRTLGARPMDKQLTTSRETLEIYAPIAHRLGIRALKEELEDISIIHLDNIAYEEIAQKLNEQKDDREKFLNDIKERITVRLNEQGVNVYVDGRIKSIHGIYRKMYMQGKSINEIYDVYAIRIIVDNIVECYNVLGTMHDLFKALPGRFKDYISTPKPNLYQSLHTTLISRESIPFEVQIRTWEMHQTAEYGIAAHWKYKESNDKNDVKMDERLAWIRQLLESQSDSDDVEDIVSIIKTDLSQEDVFVITPKGDVKSLPVGSTVIDFAYSVHSAVGNKMVGAKVDGRIVSIDYKVKNGQVVSIITSTSQTHGPSRDWLKIVTTHEAKNKIRTWFKKEKRTENIERGRGELEHEFKRNNFKISLDKDTDLMAAVSSKFYSNNLNDFYASIGYGGISMVKVMNKVKDEYNKRFHELTELLPENIVLKPSKASINGVIIEGIDNCLVKLSRCCNPIPGDDIIGFITRGHGVSVHKCDCTNVPNDIPASTEPDRWIRADWDTGKKVLFKATLTISAFDRSSLLSDLTTTLSSMHLMLHAINAREQKQGNCAIVITISIESKQHLESIISKLNRIQGILSIERTGI